MKISIYSFIPLLICSSSFGQVNLSEHQISKLDSIATQDVPDGAQGIVTAIISEGQVVYQNYAGFENLEDSLKLGSQSRFNIASNGKQFTALAILLLEEQGKLDISTDIRTYLPNSYKNVNHKISIRHLLHHTSGIRDVYDLWSLKGITWWKETYDNNDVLNLLESQEELNFIPGTQYRYSNSNYILLAEIVKRVNKTSFVDFTNQLFSQLNMNDTSFENGFTTIDGPVAQPYFNFDTWSNYDWKWNALGDGNLFSTLSDQIKWEKAVQGYSDPKISRETVNRSQKLDTSNNKFNYGFGLEFGEYKGIPYRFHEGSTGAWKATVVRFERENLSIITMTNSGKTIPSMQTRQMIDVVFDLKSNANEAISKPEKIGSFVSEDEILGMYLTPENFSFEFKRNNDGSLVLNRIGRGEIELEREADNIFRQKYDPDFKQEFNTNENGEMVVTAYHTSHAPYSLTRVNSDWEGYNFQLLNGTYVNSETDVEIVLEYQNNQHYRFIRNGEESTGILLTPNKLLVNNYVLEFDIESDKISNLFLSADRLQNVRFKRKE